MKLQAELNNDQYFIEIKREDEKIFATVEGRQYEIEASQPEPNIYLLKHLGKIFQVFILPRNIQGQPFTVEIRNSALEIKVFDPKKLRGAGATGPTADGIAEIRTAMPGKLVRVLVSVGEEITAGGGVLVVEAMKMQNEMKSPKDGIVREIRFAEGATVNAGDVLAVIE